MRGVFVVKEKLIGCQILGTAAGCAIGFALAGSVGTLFGAVIAIVIAGALACVIVPQALKGREAPSVREAVPAPMTPPQPAERPSVQGADFDFLGIAEEMAFASQQLLWGIDQYRTVIAQVEALAHGISKESETNASSVEEASAGVEEIAASASKVSDVAQSSLTECENSTKIATDYQHVIRHVSESIQDVTRTAQQSVEEIGKLNEASEKIASFVGKIRAIAAQTNLLALNASIEAARAGEHGRGFAVVAGEVGKLATESDETTREIEEIVNDITSKTETVTAGMRTSSENLLAVEQQAQASAGSMKGLTDNMAHIETIVSDLCSMSDRQRETTEQMAKAVESVGQTTVAIAGNTQEASDSIESQRKNLDEIHTYAQSLLGISERVQRAAMAFKQPDELVFAVNPFTAPERIRATYVPILQDVAKRAGKRARTIIVADYDALGRALADGLADVGWFSPFAYVAASERSRIQPIVTPSVHHQTSYTGYIVTRKGSGLNDVDALAGKRFGFVDEKSASGYVYPKAALVAAGKDPERFFGSTVFLGSHTNVIEAVKDGTVDGGATYSTAYDAAHADDQLQIIFRTDPIPTDVIAAAEAVDPAVVDALREAFEATDDTASACAAAMRGASIDGFVATSDSDYDVVRKAAAVK